MNNRHIPRKGGKILMLVSCNANHKTLTWSTRMCQSSTPKIPILDRCLSQERPYGLYVAEIVVAWVQCTLYVCSRPRESLGCELKHKKVAPQKLQNPQ